MPLVSRIPEQKLGFPKFYSRSHDAAFSEKTGSTAPGRFQNIWRFRRSFCRLWRLPKRIGLKSYLRLSALVVISPDYVIRRLDALSAGLKNRLEGLTFAETPLSA